jgi:LysM repeat protein
MLEGIKEKATQPIGPLPAFAWVVVVVGGYFGYKFLKGRSSSSSSSDTSTAVGATDTTGTVGASSTDVNALTEQISTLGNQINTLTGKVSGTLPDSPTTPVTKTPVLGGTPITTTTALTHKFTNGETLVSVAKRYGITARNILTANGMTGSIYQSVTGKTLKLGHLSTTVTTAVTTATNTATAAASTTATVASTAVSDVASAAPGIQYGSNTAVTTSVGNAINITAASGAASGLQNMASPLKAPVGNAIGSIPTINSNPVKSSTIKIAAMTPTKRIVPATVVKPSIVGTSGLKKTSKVN